MQRKYVKADATECIADIGVVTHYWDNSPNTYCGRISFSEKGMTLFSHTMPTERLTKDDALMDAINALHDGEFGSWK
jgi:hypothetical protein